MPASSRSSPPPVQLTKGRFTYDFGDTGHLTRWSRCTLGSTFIPPGIHAGGLRYHGMAPLVSHVMNAEADRSHHGPAVGRLRRRHSVRRAGHHPAPG